MPWLGWTCGHCRYCTSGRENLCDAARFTGYQIDGGYAEYTLADARYCFPLAESAAQAAEQAPLLCAGLIGYRALRLAGGAERVGIYGFGAAAHIVAQVVRHQGHRFYAFTRPGDVDSQAFARQLGAAWAGAVMLVGVWWDNTRAVTASGTSAGSPNAAPAPDWRPGAGE